ncbi:YjfB family protein [Anaerobacillus sp. HL2]|nr:YjfB family protein [Anaerobacillus sp. HL2]
MFEGWDIALLSMAPAMIKSSNKLSMSVMKKAMDQSEQGADGLQQR